MSKIEKLKPFSFILLRFATHSHTLLGVDTVVDSPLSSFAFLLTRSPFSLRSSQSENLPLA